MAISANIEAEAIVAVVCGKGGYGYLCAGWVTINFLYFSFTLFHLKGGGGAHKITNYELRILSKASKSPKKR